MKIVFITDQPVPNGLAPTNRLLSLAAGINQNDCDVTILILNPTEKASHINNTELVGAYKGVAYKYLTGTTVLPIGKFNKFFVFLKGLLKLIKELKKINLDSRIDAIIISHTWSIYPIAVYYLFIRLKRITYLQERNEYPFLNRSKNIFRRLDYFLYTKLVLPHFDGLLVITKNLKNYYSQFLNKNALIAVIPMTVEPERFGQLKKDNSHKYIAYCGYLGGNKDGVYDLIKAFSIISKEFPDYYLYIIGDSKKTEEIVFLQKLAKDKDVIDRIIFTGKVSREDMPALLDKAELLALSRPNSIQAEGGFPTKLGEYLATGNPVVITRVGEVPDFLIDGVNAYLAEPDNVSDFALKLKLALAQKENSVLIGQKGKELAYSVFNYKVQGQRIIEFIHQIQARSSN